MILTSFLASLFASPWPQDYAVTGWAGFQELLSLPVGHVQSSRLSSDGHRIIGWVERPAIEIDGIVEKPRPVYGLAHVAAIADVSDQPGYPVRSIVGFQVVMDLNLFNSLSSHMMVKPRMSGCFFMRSNMRGSPATMMARKQQLGIGQMKQVWSYQPPDSGVNVRIIARRLMAGESLLPWHSNGRRLSGRPGHPAFPI